MLRHVASWGDRRVPMARLQAEAAGGVKTPASPTAYEISPMAASVGASAAGQDWPDVR